jgi:predicted metalloendopeptidase
MNWDIDILENLIKEIHAPFPFRINNAAKNTVDFLESFACEVGDNMFINAHERITFA